MGDLPGVRGMWRTLVGQWEKKFNYFYICICIRILIQICIWIRGRGITGDRRSGRGGVVVEDVSRRVHDDRGWSRTIGDGLRGRGRSRTV